MKRISRTLLSLVLCLTVALSMCITFTQPVSAVSPVSNGGTISAPDINTSNTNAVTYQVKNSDRLSKDFTFKVGLVSNGGTIFVRYPNSGVGTVKVNGTYSTDSLTAGSNYLKAFNVPSGTTATLTMTVYGNTSVTFGVWSAPINRTIAANGTEYVLGSPAGNSSAVSSFTFTAPGKGYVEIASTGGMDTNYPYSAQITSSGFKGWEYLYSSQGYKTFMGVKKGGVYKVSVKSVSGVRNVKVTFHSVKETSSKTSKKKAAKIKRKKVNKGLIISNNKKVHWYKIKNTKNRKMKIVVNAAKIGEGSSSGGKLKITCYFPDKKKQYATLYPGRKGTYTVTYGKIGTKKARKGTYYIKVQSIGGANGYYTLQWK